MSQPHSIEHLGSSSIWGQSKNSFCTVRRQVLLAPAHDSVQRGEVAVAEINAGSNDGGAGAFFAGFLRLPALLLRRRPLRRS